MTFDHVLTKPELRQAKPRRATFAGLPRNPITVVCDGITSAYNLGAIFRLADAFLVERLIICGTTIPHLTCKRRLVSTARGTQRWVPWCEAPDATPVVADAKRAGAWVAAVELTAAAIDVAEITPRYPAVVVLGSERKGISPSVLAYADTAIAIPMAGMSSSLNVASAAAIVLHEFVRRHKTLAPL